MKDERKNEDFIRNDTTSPCPLVKLGPGGDYVTEIPADLDEPVEFKGLEFAILIIGIMEFVGIGFILFFIYWLWSGGRL